MNLGSRPTFGEFDRCRGPPVRRDWRLVRRIGKCQLVDFAARPVRVTPTLCGATRRDADMARALTQRKSRLTLRFRTSLPHGSQPLKYRLIIVGLCCVDLPVVPARRGDALSRHADGVLRVDTGRRPLRGLSLQGGMYLALKWTTPTAIAPSRTEEAIDRAVDRALGLRASPGRSAETATTTSSFSSRHSGPRAGGEAGQNQAASSSRSGCRSARRCRDLDCQARG
jgi:hypothetical protein